MNKGFSLPIVIIVALFISLPVIYFLSISKPQQQTVKGVSSVKNSGFSIQIKSTNGTWDLLEFLCNDMDECTQSLTSGKRVETISGGITDSYEVFLEPSSDWDNYEFIKIYAKPGWGSSARTFSVVDKGVVPGTIVQTFTEDDVEQPFIIIPLDPVKSEFYTSANLAD